MTGSQPHISSAAPVTVSDLLERLKSGQPDAGPSLVSMCGARLAQYSRLVAPQLSEADRDELCEYAVERAIERIELYDSSRGSFESWLRGFFRREVYEFSRRTSSIVMTDDDLDRLGSPLTSSASYADKHLNRERLQERRKVLRRLMCSLSETDQLILALRNYEILSYKTISERLSISEWACRQRYSRALARLRAKIYDDGTFADLWESSNE